MRRDKVGQHRATRPQTLLEAGHDQHSKHEKAEKQSRGLGVTGLGPHSAPVLLQSGAGEWRVDLGAQTAQTPDMLNPDATGLGLLGSELLRLVMLILGLFHSAVWSRDSFTCSPAMGRLSASRHNDNSYVYTPLGTG